MQVFLIILFFIFMMGDVVGRIKSNNKFVKLFQPGTTLIVLIIAARNLFSGNTEYVALIVGGLAISTFADSILVNRDNKKLFVVGMGLFLIAISIYGFTFTKFNGFQKQDILVTFIMLVVALILMFLVKNGKNGTDGIPSKKIIIGVSVYTLVFCFVISRAISTFYGDYFNTTQSILLTIGTILFFLGDCQLGIYHFINKNFPMVQAPPFYFIGQLLIGLSCSFF